MKGIFVILLVVLVTGCATVKGPIGSLGDLPKPITSKASVYGQLVKERGEWTLSGLCSEDSSVSRTFRCNRGSLQDPYQNYINLRTLSPTYSTQGIICSTMLFVKHDWGYNRKPSNSENRCVPEDYWDSNIAWGEFGQYLFVIPAVVLAYYKEVYFDYEEFGEAVNKALSNRAAVERVNAYVAELDREKDRAAQVKAQKEEEYRIKRLEEKEAKEAAIRRFERASKEQKSIGSKVCDIENRIGYVEKIAGTKVNVLIKVKIYGDDYRFFDARKDSISQWDIKAVDTLVWDESSKWGLCDFDISY